MSDKIVILKIRSRDGSTVRDLPVGELIAVDGMPFVSDAADDRLSRIEAQVNNLHTVLCGLTDDESSTEGE